MTTTALNEGWYPDGKGGQRHWDGLKWDGQIVLPPPNYGRRAAIWIISAVIAAGGAIGFGVWKASQQTHQECLVEVFSGERPLGDCH